MRRRAAAGLVALLAAGFGIPRWLIPAGSAGADGDPLAAEVARAAVDAVRSLSDNPLARALFPGARVLRVWRDPGHCPRGEPGADRPTADYRAEARAYAWFGIPGPRVAVSCGGWSYRLAARPLPRRA